MDTVAPANQRSGIDLLIMTNHSIDCILFILDPYVTTSSLSVGESDSPRNCCWKIDVLARTVYLSSVWMAV